MTRLSEIKKRLEAANAGHDGYVGPANCEPCKAEKEILTHARADLSFLLGLVEQAWEALEMANGWFKRTRRVSRTGAADVVANAVVALRALEDK